MRHLGVPQFEGLSTKDILNWAKSYPEVALALPIEQREVEKLYRQYIINVVYTLVGSPFKKWVDKVLEDRSKRITEEKNLAIELDPEILKAFKASSSVSGKFDLNLLTQNFLLQ